MKYVPSKDIGPAEALDKPALRQLFKVLKHDIETAPAPTAIKIASANTIWMVEMGNEAHALLNDLVAKRRKETEPETAADDLPI